MMGRQMNSGTSAAYLKGCGIVSVLDRRSLLGVLAAAAFGAPAFAHDMAGMAMAGTDDGLAMPVVTPFAAPRHAALDRFVDLVIPKTDTAGAREAGVSTFIELMYEHWMTDEQRRRCDAELDLVIAAFAKGGDPIPLLYADGRFKMPTLRKLTIYGYYTSEAGASEELDLNLIPGAYDACATITSSDHAPALATWGITLDLNPEPKA